MVLNCVIDFLYSSGIFDFKSCQNWYFFELAVKVGNYRIAEFIFSIYNNKNILHNISMDKWSDFYKITKPPNRNQSDVKILNDDI